MVRRMEIAWFTEMNFDGKINRDHKNMRTEYAWWVAQNATHHNILKLQSLPDNAYDIGVIIIPKKVKHYMQIDVVTELQRVCKKYAFMQEGPSWYFQSLPLDQSLWFFNVMLNADFVLSHNDCDKKYYEGLLDKPTFINPTLMIDDVLNIDQVERSGTIIGGNLVRWYGGFNSFIIAQESEQEIFAPQMGRMDELEPQMEDITHLPYMQWDGWMKSLNNFKYAVHMNPNTIAGTFHLNCAYLGIPCIGNVNTDTQRICFPELSVDPADMHTAKKIMKKLCNDDDFYLYCSNESKKLYAEHYHESVYNESWNKILNHVI